MVINRYILKNLIGVCVFITLILTLLVMLTQSLRFLELIIEAGAPPLSFFQLIGLAIPRFLEVILPLSIVTAVIFIYNKMISENELIVLRASGATQRQLMMPALYMSVIGFLVLAFLTFWGAPYAHGKLEVLRGDIKTQYAGLLLREGVFNAIDDGLMIYMDEREDNRNMVGLLIHDTRDENVEPVTIIAERGEVFVKDRDTTEVIVYNGQRQNYKPETRSLDILKFKEYTLEVTNTPADPKTRWKQEDERTIFELINPGERTLSNETFKFRVTAEIHRRIAMPFSVFTFVIVSLACLLVGAFNRRGHSRRIILAAFFVIALESLYVALTNLIEERAWAIPLLYLSVILPLIGGIYMISPAGEKLRRAFVKVKKVKK